jgi:SAM-dependent methyltransferase
VKAIPDSLFALPEIEAMLRCELALMPPHAARQPGGRALLLQPHAIARALPFDLGHLDAIRLHADGALLRGDAVAAPGALPFENESFQMVFVQHVADAGADAALPAEIARVVAPGGLVLWCGFNPWSPWLAWMRWHARGGLAMPATTHADALRRRLLRARLVTLTLDYLGPCWPRRADASIIANEGRASRWLAPLRGVFLIAARKQRAVLTPLRPRVKRNAVALGTRFAGTPSQRARA